MFGQLSNYESERCWRKHPLLHYDSLMRENAYLVMATLRTTERPDDFRYDVDLDYEMTFDAWLQAVKARAYYETGVDARYGDEILTLVTCSYHAEDGKFVLIARKLRAGEETDR